MDVKDFQTLLEGWVMIYTSIINQEYKGLEKKIQELSDKEKKMTLSAPEKDSINEMKQAIKDFIPLDIEKPFEIQPFGRSHNLVYYSCADFKRPKIRMSQTLGPCTAYLAGIHIEVDPIPERLCFKDYEADAEERMRSKECGSLFIFENGICWTPEKQAGQVKGREVEVWMIAKGVVCLFNDMEFYNLEAIPGAEDKTFILSIHTRKEVMLIFPLLSTDLAHTLKQFIAYFAKPMISASIIKNILTQKLNIVRLMGVLHLMEQDHPYIEQFNDLKDVVRRLTTPDSSLYELERLFHSCKRETVVLKETFSLLQSIWDKSNESSRLRILAVADRLLDPILITPGMDIFKELFKWLGQLEENLNPYKNADLLYCVSVMLDRMRHMRGKLWAIRSEFDLWKDYELVTDEYRYYATKGLWS